MKSKPPTIYRLSYQRVGWAKPHTRTYSKLASVETRARNLLKGSPDLAPLFRLEIHAAEREPWVLLADLLAEERGGESS